MSHFYNIVDCHDVCCGTGCFPTGVAIHYDDLCWCCYSYFWDYSSCSISSWAARLGCLGSSSRCFGLGLFGQFSWVVRLVVGGYYGFGAGIIVAGNSGIVMVPGLLAIMVSG